MRGLRVLRGGRIETLVATANHRALPQHWHMRSHGDAHVSASLPDLGDPATIGCLLALVREAHGLPKANTLADGYADMPWRFESPCRSVKMRRVWFPTEAEALVAALEAAP